MKLPRQYYEVKNRIKDIIVSICTYRKHLDEVSQLPQKSVILWGTPDYGNLGDQAIAHAEVEFVKEELEVSNIFIVPEKKCMEYIYPMKKFAYKKKMLFLLQGGGNMGEMYAFQERCRQMLIKKIKNSSLVVFPQSVDFVCGSRKHKKAKNIYQNNANLSLYARDKITYQRMKDLFPKCNILLVPDIVTILDKSEKKQKREGVLFCLRSDQELNKNSKREIDQLFKFLENNKMMMLDTYNTDFASEFHEQEKLLEEFWGKMRGAKLVVTDRLHGMIFSMITNTPCVAFDNSTRKVSGFYRTWFADIPGIFMYDHNFDQMIEFVENVLKCDEKLVAIKNLSDKFEPLLVELKKHYIED